MANVTNYKKHGYFHGIEDHKPATAMKIFCMRRAGDVVKDFGSNLTHNELLARIYYQGLKDGQNIWGNDGA